MDIIATWNRTLRVTEYAYSMVNLFLPWLKIFLEFPLEISIQFTIERLMVNCRTCIYNAYLRNRSAVPRNVARWICIFSDGSERKLWPRDTSAATFPKELFRGIPLHRLKELSLRRRTRRLNLLSSELHHVRVPN